MRTVLLSVFMVLLLLSCSSRDHSSIRTDIAGLRKTINIPYKPKDLIWEIKPIGSNRSIGPTDYILMASFSLEKGEFGELKSKYAVADDISNEVVLKEEFVSDWFLNAIQSISTRDKEAYKVENPAYKAREFYKSPYLNGICFFKDDGTVFLLLGTS
ncbi:MAG: hypothetical protein HEP71_30610 [Roseivirga sp.]|nr:hypothetical protein [Roseivirga sp.]